MFESIRNSLITWNAKTGERQKLQHAYLVLVIIIVFIAGIVSLTNADKGHSVVIMALIIAGIFLANALAWNLLQSAILSRLPKQSRRK